MYMQCSAHTGRQWLTPTTTPPLPTSTPRYPTTTHSTSIHVHVHVYRSSLSMYARVAIVYLSSIFFASHGPWLIACTEQEHAVARDDQIESECALYRTIKFVGGESSRLARACAHAYCAL